MHACAHVQAGSQIAILILKAKNPLENTSSCCWRREQYIPCMYYVRICVAPVRPNDKTRQEEAGRQAGSAGRQAGRQATGATCTVAYIVIIKKENEEEGTTILFIKPENPGHSRRSVVGKSVSQSVSLASWLGIREQQPKFSHSVKNPLVMYLAQANFIYLCVCLQRREANCLTN